MQIFVVRAAAMVLLAFGLLAGSATAQEAASCDTQVVDLTKQQVMKDHPEVQAEADKLKALKVDVRIRALQKAPEGGLDGYLATQMNKCSTWREEYANEKGKLLLIVFSLDPELHLSYAPGLDGALKEKADAVKADLQSALNREDYASGTSTAESTLAAAVEQKKKSDTTMYIIIIVVVVVIVIILLIVSPGLLGAILDEW